MQSMAWKVVLVAWISSWDYVLANRCHCSCDVGNASQSQVEAVSATLPSHEDASFYSPSHHAREFWLYVGVCSGLIIMAGLMAGLTVGLLSLDQLNIQILQMEGSEAQKKRARRVLPIITQHHYLLVTLLLVNAAANEALPIFLNKLVDEFTAILLSVSFVLLFGEIIPSAIFTGPKQLNILAAMIPFVRLLMFITSPISYPLSRLLDYILGDDNEITTYKRKELKALITLQKETVDIRKVRSPRSNRSCETPPLMPSKYSAHGTTLNIDEVTVIHGALDLATKTVSNLMIPMEEVFMLDITSRLNDELMADIMHSGFSRIPVYKGHRNNIVGILLVKRLIILDPEDERLISELQLRHPIVVSPNYSCYSLLNEFQKGRSHIALLTHEFREVQRCWAANEDIKEGSVQFIGIVTIEDVLEELIQEEIEDESDIIYREVLKVWDGEYRKKRFQEAGLRTAGKKLKQLAAHARYRIKQRREMERQETRIDVSKTEKTPLLPSSS